MRIQILRLGEIAQQQRLGADALVDGRFAFAAGGQQQKTSAYAEGYGETRQKTGDSEKVVAHHIAKVARAANGASR